MTHPLQCRCGSLKGFVSHSRDSFRGVCYCGDCQAFAHFLGRAADVLDERGGSEVIQLLPKNITFMQGTERLACVRLTARGLLRWYASCCGTPVGNMMANRKLSFIGLVRTCLESPGHPLDESFGPIRAWVHPEGAKGSPRPKQAGFGAMVGFFLSTALKARINGDYRANPFFHPDTGAPVAQPRVLSREERASVMMSVPPAR